MRLYNSDQIDVLYVHNESTELVNHRVSLCDAGASPPPSNSPHKAIGEGVITRTRAKELAQEVKYMLMMFSRKELDTSMDTSMRILVTVSSKEEGLKDVRMTTKEVCDLHAHVPCIIYVCDHAYYHNLI